MKRHLTTLLILAATIGLVAGTVLLRKHRMTAVMDLPDMGNPPWALHTEAVVEGRLSRGFPVLASLTGSNEITISSQISGLIESMGPREGVKVHKGEILAQISVADLQRQREGLVAQREAALAQRKRTRDEYERQKQLMQKRLTTQELVDAKNAASIAAHEQVANLDKQLAAMDVRIGYGTVTTSRDALVAEHMMEAGDVAQPGKPLYRLTVDSAARLRVTLPQQVLEQVHPGSEVELEHGSLKQTVRLSRIFPALDSRAMGAAEADIEAMPFGLPSGARIPARVLLETADHVLKVSHQAVLRSGNSGLVFKAVESDGGLRLRRITIQIILDARDGLGVEGELRAGDRLVVAHQSVLMKLRDGDPVVLRQAIEGRPVSGSKS